MNRPYGEECQCAVCGLLFTSVSAFDLHRRGNVCTPPDQIVTKKTKERLLFGRRRSRNGVGRVVWGGRADDRHERSPEGSCGPVQATEGL